MSDKPQVVVADAQYHNGRQIDDLIGGHWIPALIPPEANGTIPLAWLGRPASSGLGRLDRGVGEEVVQRSEHFLRAR